MNTPAHGNISRHGNRIPIEERHHGYPGLEVGSLHGRRPLGRHLAQRMRGHEWQGRAQRSSQSEPKAIPNADANSQSLAVSNPNAVSHSDSNLHSNSHAFADTALDDRTCVCRFESERIAGNTIG